jgi:hypothetical protein
VAAEIVHDHDVGGLQFGNEKLFDIGLERDLGGRQAPQLITSRRCAIRSQQLAQQAERNSARFVDRWRTRPSKAEARERLNPARNE